jgi:hypothetical protein
VLVHHTLKEHLDAYLTAAAIREGKKGPLLRTLSTAPGRPLSLEAMTQPNAWRMTCPPEAPRRRWMRQRARDAGIKTKTSLPTPQLRPTGLPTPRGERFVVRGLPRGYEAEVEVVCRFLPSGRMRIITVYRAED